MERQTATLEPAPGLTADRAAFLSRAKAGDTYATGALLKSYSHYLLLIARLQIGRRLQEKIDADDLVQETFLEAHRQFSQFRGGCEREFTAWLRSIMAGQIALLLRRYLGTQARDMQLERRFATHADDSGKAAPELAGTGTSPSQHVVRREQAVQLADALSHLETRYREVIVLRHIEQLSFEEVAVRMERTSDSVQKLWVRALAQLRQAMGVRGGAS